MKAQLIKYAATGLLISASINAIAQDQNDVLRFSNYTTQGTARSIGFGNALGSIGGDFSSLSVNPAGIGIYRKSEIMISPSMMFGNSDAQYNPQGNGLGSSSSDNGSHFALSNVGFVTTSALKGSRYNRSEWKSVSFAMGHNRIADFTRNYTYNGTNTSSSQSWRFENDANKYPDQVLPNSDYPGPGYLGYQTYLLDTATINGTLRYISVVNPSAASPVRQQQTVRERGGISEFNLSFGGNYQDKLLLGATIGLPYVRYIKDVTYREDDLSGNTNNDFATYTETTWQKTTGMGFNAKLGLIFKPVDAFRIGLAFHTPTWYSLKEESSDEVTANTENFGGIQTVSLPNNVSNYNVATPFRSIFSASVLLGKFGFITADYEYVDYASSRIRFDQNYRDYQDVVNSNIKNTYKGASNIRAGIELRHEIFAIRGGIGYYGSPYKNSASNDGERYDISGGLGLRFSSSYIDLGIVHRQYKSTETTYYVPYSGYINPVANITSNQTNAVLTFGWKL